MRVGAALASALTVCVAVASPAGAAEPIMKLADVRAGMQCTGLSTIRGTAVAEFGVEVIDVLRGDPASLGPRLLVRTYGPAVDATGVGPGFSGSPIYCVGDDGVRRVAGAISEAIGEYGNDVVLATPIEAVLEVRPVRAPQARDASGLLRSARPLAAPLTVSGVSSTVRRTLVAAARRAGTQLFATPSAPSTPYPPYPLVPGSPVAAGLSSGDIALAAIGTVTYRDGARLWAFGHPLDGSGRRSLPLLDAYVYTIVDNPLGLFEATTYKLATAGRPVGRLTTDGLSAIAGRVGKPPRTIPLTATARRGKDGPRRTVAVEVADERRFGLSTGLDLVGTIAASEAAATALGATPGRFTTSMCLRVEIRQTPGRLGFCGRYFNGFAPLGALSSAFGLIDGFEYGRLGIERVRVGMNVRPRVREAFIVGARARRRVRPGQRVRVRLRLQRSRAGRRTVSFRYRIPRLLGRGRHVLQLRGSSSEGGSSLAGIFGTLFGISIGDGGQQPPRSVSELALRIRSLAARNGVHATFAKKGKGPLVYRSEKLRIRGSAQIPFVVRKRP